MLVDWKSIYSPTPRDEMEQLEKYCQEVVGLANFDIAIEIGSYQGGSAALMASYFHRVICIDPFGLHETEPGERIAKFSSGIGQNEHYPIFMQNMERLGLTDRVFLIVSTDKCFDAIKPVIPPILIFIDDAHTYKEVKEELERAWFLIHPDGLVVVHDYMRQPYSEPHDSYIGVKQAVDESIEKGLYTKHHYYSGIVALKKVAI